MPIPTMVLTTSAGLAAAQTTRREAGFRVELSRDWRQAFAHWRDFTPSTPFQHPQWYDAWYSAFAATKGVSPLIAVVTDATTGELALLLPLIRRRQGRVDVVEFADLDVTDYNGPLLGSAAPRDAGAVRAMWRSLLSALRRMPDAADYLRLRKMPVDFSGRPNPLALLGVASPCSNNGNIIAMGEDYDAWRYTLERTVRKELERSWRVFTRDPAASFSILSDPDEALRILSVTEVQQRARMQSLGNHYFLDDPDCAALFRNLVLNSVGNGFVLVSTLTVGEEVVATLLGIRSGSHYVMVRISNAGEKWSKCSPGRLIIERTMAALHGAGVREFDFSIGNFDYKRRFGVQHLPLVAITAALSWRGLPLILRDRVAQALRPYPRVKALLKRVLGNAADWARLRRRSECRGQ